MADQTKIRNLVRAAIVDECVHFALWWWRELRKMLSEHGLIKKSNQPHLILDLESNEIGIADKKLDKISADTEDNTSGSIVDTIRQLVLVHDIKKIAINLPEIIEIRVSLPEAAKTNLGDFIKYDLDRHIPFQYDQVAVTYQYLEHDQDNKTIKVVITFCPKAQLEFAYDIAKQAGCTLDYLGKDVLAGAKRNLLASAPTARTDSKTRFKLSAIALLVLAATMTSLLQKYYNNQKLENELEITRTQLAARSKILNDLEKELNWIPAVSRQPVTLDALQLLSRNIEGTGLVSYVAWSSAQMKIAGTVQNTANFIQKLAKQETVKSVEYLSPVEQVDDGRMEKFDLKIEFSLEQKNE